MATLQHMEVLGWGSDLSCSCNTGSTHCDRLGIEPASWYCRDPMVSQWELPRSEAFFFFFLLFRVKFVTYGGSQARGQIEATAAGLHYSHSNTKSEPHLQPTPQLTAMPESPTHWAGSGIEPASSWILVRFVSTAPQWELPQCWVLNLLSHDGNSISPRIFKTLLVIVNTPETLLVIEIAQLPISRGMNKVNHGLFTK